MSYINTSQAIAAMLQANLTGWVVQPGPMVDTLENGVKVCAFRQTGFGSAAICSEETTWVVDLLDTRDPTQGRAGIEGALRAIIDATRAPQTVTGPSLVGINVTDANPYNTTDGRNGASLTLRVFNNTPTA